MVLNSSLQINMHNVKNILESNKATKRCLKTRIVQNCTEAISFLLFVLSCILVYLITTQNVM